MRLPNGSEVIGAQPARVDLPLALSILGPQNRERQNKSLLLGRIQRIFDNPSVLGGVWTCDPEFVRQDSTGTTAAAVGAPVGLVYDQSGRSVDGSQATTANKATLKRWPSSDIYWCLTETGTTALTVTFPSSLGSSCYRAVAGVSGIREYFGQTIGTTLNLVDAPLFGQVVLNRAPTDHERRLILAWLRHYVPMAQPSLAAVQAIYAAGAVGGVWLPVEGALFADTTGATAATVGSTIGMVYDQSRGIALGSELVVDGGFSTPGSWSVQSGAEITSGVLRLTSAQGTWRGYQASSAAQYKSYRVTFSIKNWSAGSVAAVVLNASLGIGPSHSGNGIYTDTIFSSGSGSSHGFTATATATMDIDDFSIREIPGAPALQSNASYRPTLRQAPESRVLFSDVSPASPALTATFASTVGATSTVIEVTPTGIKKRVASVSTTFNLLTQYKYWGGTVLVNRATTDAEDAAILALMEPFVPRLGANIVSNGTFDADASWAKGTGWSIGSGIASKTSGTASNLTESVATSTVIYWAGMDVTRTAGTIGAYPGSGTTQFGSQAATATDVWAVVQASGTGVGFRGDASFAGSIDNARWLPIL